MTQKLKDHWYWTFGILSILCFTMAYKQYQSDKTNPYYQQVSRKCVVIEKHIEQYNASDNRVIDLRNKMVLICKSEGVIFPVNVSTNDYYRTNPKDTVYFTLSKQDMYEPFVGNQNSRCTAFSYWLVFGFVFAITYVFTRLHVRSGLGH